jgi:phospholipid/cholesterol/gamma-HCH transport system substrate-binding protein
MNKRILANLVFFVFVSMLLAVWAVNNVISFDFLKHPYRVTATFDTSPGLFAGSQLTYLGHAIGTVGSVKLHDGNVLVTLKIDNGVKLPAALSASVLRQSAVGEPYVELDPLPGTNPNGGKLLAKGDHIPIEHTSTPLAYSDLFKALGNLVGAVPPQDLNTLVHELALGLNGRSDSIRQLFAGADQLTAAFAAKSDELDATLTALTQFTHMLAGQSGALGSSVDNIAALAASLHQSSQTIAALLDTGPGFAGRVADIIARSKGDLGCLFDALGAVSARLNSATLAAELAQTISTGPQLLAILKDVTDIQPDGPYNKGNFEFNVGGPPPVPAYTKPLTLPAVPALPTCTGSTLAASGSGPPSATGGAITPVGPGGSNAVPGAGTPVHPGGPGVASPSTKPASGGGVSPLLKTALWVMLALLVLLGLFVAARRWIWVPLKRDRDDLEPEAPAPIEAVVAVGAAPTSGLQKELEDGNDD